MWFSIVCIVIGVVIAAELIYCIATWNTVSDFTYFIRRPFGIEMSLFAGFITRVILIVLEGVAVFYGISYWFYS